MSTTDQPAKAISGDARTIGLLRQMMLIRAIEQKSVELSTSAAPKILGSLHLCAGQEAVPVGALASLRPDDQVVATYRGHGWALAAGLTPLEVFGEICHRTVGINGGRGGSAYMMAPHRRFIGENSIVGAGLPIACGVAMSNVAAKNGSVVVVSLGEGAFNQGSTHEGLAFAAALNLPILVICENNGWSELTPSSKTYKINRIAQRASGYGMTGLTIDGSDVLAVQKTVAQAVANVREGAPVLIECRVPRLWGHYNRDIEHYRPKADKEEAKSRDPITLLSMRLLESGALDESQFKNLKDDVDLEVEETVRRVLDSPEPEPVSARDHVWSTASDSSTPDAGPLITKTMSFVQALNEALSTELQTRPEVLLYGEDVGFAGGIFGASKGLQAKYGESRVFDTPISESAILGSAVGAAITGMKPIVEIMWADFILVALDQVINQAANVRYITSGKASVPIVIRTQQGMTPGSCAQHSQCLEALLAHIPGVRVAVASTPQDSYSLLRSAVSCPDPCILFESRALYPTQGEVQTGGIAEQIGVSRLARPGKDALIVTWGTMLRTSLEAAESLQRDGIDSAVLDLRWLCPLDLDGLSEAVINARGHVVIAHEANLTGGFGAEVFARVHEMLGDKMALYITRIGTPDVRIPAAPVLQRQLVPSSAVVAEAVRHVISAGKLKRMER